MTDLRNELKTLMPDVQTFSAARSLVMNATRDQPDTVLLVYARFSCQYTAAGEQRLERWLQSRTKSKKIKLLVEWRI